MTRRVWHCVLGLNCGYKAARRRNNALNFILCRTVSPGATTHLKRSTAPIFKKSINKMQKVKEIFCQSVKRSSKSQQTSSITLSMFCARS